MVSHDMLKSISSSGYLPEARHFEKGIASHIKDASFDKVIIPEEPTIGILHNFNFSSKCPLGLNDIRLNGIQANGGNPQCELLN